MGNFRPKEVFRQAQAAEKAGRKRTASSGYASVAVHLRKKEKFKEAKTILARAVQLTPDSPRLYLQLALCEVGLKNSSAAQERVKLFARLTIERKKVEEYIPYVENLLKPLPALRQLFYEAVLETDRTDARPFLAVAKAQMEQSLWEPAQRTLLDALKTKTHADEAVPLLKDVLSRRGRNDLLFHLKNFEAGRTPLKDLLLLLSDRGTRAAMPPPEDEEKALSTLIEELEVEMGIDLDEKHDKLEPLVREFRRKSEKILKGDSKARIDMGLAFFEMGLMDEARDELRNVPPTDPLYLEAQVLTGDILFAQGSDLGALEVFKKCLRDERAAEGVRSEARYKLIQVYFRLGDYKQALAAALELERSAPEYRDLRRLKVQVQEMAASHPSGTEEWEEKEPTLKRRREPRS